MLICRTGLCHFSAQSRTAALFNDQTYTGIVGLIMSSAVDFPFKNGSTNQPGKIHRKKEKYFGYNISRSKNPFSHQQRAYTCFAIFALILVAGLTVTSFVIYNQLVQRIAYLEEEMMTTKDWITKMKDIQEGHHQTEKIRIKRTVTHCDCRLSTGFPSSSIAMFYGYNKELEKARSAGYGKENSPKLVFTNQTGDPELNSIKRCKTIWRNGYKSIWCEAKAHLEKDRFMLYGHQSKYSYFRPANWMQKDSSKKNYLLKTEGRIQINSAGLYMIFANVLFTHEIGDSLGYKITMSRGTQETVLGQCVKSVPKDTDRDFGLSPCPAIVIAPLQANDEIYMDISSFVFFKVAKENMNFGLVKLTDGS